MEWIIVIAAIWAWFTANSAERSCKQMAEELKILRAKVESLEKSVEGSAERQHDRLCALEQGARAGRAEYDGP